MIAQYKQQLRKVVKSRKIFFKMIGEESMVSKKILIHVFLKIFVIILIQFLNSSVITCEPEQQEHFTHNISEYMGLNQVLWIIT